MLSDPEWAVPPDLDALGPPTAAPVSAFPLVLPAAPGPFVTPLEALRRVWGFESFRPGQAEVIDAILGGEDVIAIAPTGRGKSAIFQVSALMRPDRPVLVVSPLIALMRDQVAQAMGRGIPAVAITSQSPPAERRQLLRELPRASLVYAAPERLDDPSFAAAFGGRPPWLLAADEVHSIEEAGLSFRPAYRFIEQFVQGGLGGARPQRLALTASATAETVADVRQRLGMQGARLMRFSCDRPNLSYAVERVDKHQKEARVLSLLARHRAGGAAIIYTLSRANAEELADLLAREGHGARHYHAKMGQPARREVEGLFFGRRLDVVVATCAFGMGVDRPDVRLVVLHGMPKSVEDCYQSWGRAGRDGKPALCVALYDSRDDLRLRRWLIERGDDLEKNKWTRDRGWQDPKFETAKLRQQRLLEGADAFLRSGRCRAVLLREYFGEQGGRPCGTCDNCRRAAARGEGAT